MADANQPEVSRGHSSRMVRKLTSPRTPLAAVAIALLLTSVSIHNGLILDDCFHRAVLSGSPRFGEHLPESQGMFRFVNGDPEPIGTIRDSVSLKGPQDWVRKRG